jgi:alkylation response protein AidB-like acyl-CoA dehydrogenase
MEIALTREEREFAEGLRDFFCAEIPAEIRQKGARGGLFSREDLITSQQILNANKLAVPQWPAEWGGRDWTPVQRHLWSSELLRANVPPPVEMNVNMIGPVIATFGSPEMKRRLLPPTANLDIFWCQGFSEPNAGSDLASLTTSAVRDGDEYVINGQKTWTTRAQDADWIFCLCRTDPAVKKQRGISMLVFELDRPGVTVRPIQLIDGGHEVNEVFFDNVRVPAGQLVGEENQGWDYAKFLLSHERTGVVAVGQTKARIDRIKRLAARTAQGGRPLIEEPLFRARLAMLEIELTAIEMSVLRVLDAEGRSRPGEPDPVSSVLKWKGSELQQEATALLVEVLGPDAVPWRHEAGVPDGFPALPDGALDAFPTYFNWRKASIYSGSNEVQRTIIAKTILKI